MDRRFRHRDGVHHRRELSGADLPSNHGDVHITAPFTPLSARDAAEEDNPSKVSLPGPFDRVNELLKPPLRGTRQPSNVVVPDQR